MSVDFCCCCWFFLIFGVYVRVRCLRFQYYYFFYLFVFSFRIFKFDQLDFWMNAKYFTHFTSNKYMCFCFVYVYFFGHFFIRLSQQLFQFDSPSKNDSIDFLFRFFLYWKWWNSNDTIHMASIWYAFLYCLNYVSDWHLNMLKMEIIELLLLAGYCWLN